MLSGIFPPSDKTENQKSDNRKEYYNMKIGSHVGMSGKEMLLGSAKEAVSYGADTFMFYTGAPQNTPGAKRSAS